MKIEKSKQYFKIYVGRKSELNLSDYRIDLCPECKEKSPYNGEEYKLHECKNKECEFTGKESELISVLDDVQLEKDLSELEEFISKSRKKVKEYKKELISKIK